VSPVEFLAKMKGTTQSPPRVSGSEILLSWLGSFLGMAAVGLVSETVIRNWAALFMFGPFGASAVLIYGAVKSPLAQPRNLIGGHLLSAVVGVATYKLLPGNPWLAGSLATATAIAVMHVTKTLHPPGGATALIAVVGGDAIHSLGFLYVLLPVGAGVAIMLLVALVFNNIPKHRRYPEFWW